jgi:signal transduction histidine kinase
MLSMAERAELVGGALVVRSRPGGGTMVTVTVPIEA